MLFRSPNDTFDTNVIDPTMWVATPSGSTVAAANQELEITHPAGGWTNGALQSVGTYDQTGKSVQVQVKRAANLGAGGATYGETSIYLWQDATHYAEFFIAGSALTAWTAGGAAATNLTPSWPAYNATAMQWLRFRESGGTLYFEYASGATAPGTWTALASAPDPFAMTAVSFKIVAGSNATVSDQAQFDNVSTTGGVAPTPPVVTAASATSITSTGATVTWTTDQPADSQVSYGLTSTYGSTTVLNPALVTSHSQALTGLSPATTYYFQVVSKNEIGRAHV